MPLQKHLFVSTSNTSCGAEYKMSHLQQKEQGPWKMNYLLCWLVQRFGKATTVAERQGTKFSYLNHSTQQHCIFTCLNRAPFTSVRCLYIHPFFCVAHSQEVKKGSVFNCFCNVGGFELNMNIESQEKGHMLCFYLRNAFYLLVCLLHNS